MNVASNLSLRGVVVCAQLGHQVRGILSGVHSKRLGYHQQRLRESCDRQLLAGTLQREKQSQSVTKITYDQILVIVAGNFKFV